MMKSKSLEYRKKAHQNSWSMTQSSERNLTYPKIVVKENSKPK